jgi:hypothetical protein
MAPPNPEPEVADVPTVNLIHYTSPLTSADSTSGHTELSLPEEINSHGGISASSETGNHDSSLEEFWANLLESSIKNDPKVVTSACGGIFDKAMTIDITVVEL